MVYSFITILLMFTLIGIMSAKKSRSTKSDYYLASQQISPWLVGLSAVATNNSGYMFIGVIGYTYTVGLDAIWLMFGWILGDFLASLFVHKRLRQAASYTQEVTYAGVLSNWYGQELQWLKRLIGLISLIFLICYASAQLIAGGKALHVLLDWPIWAGAFLGTMLVVVYCVSGGIRASIWTDAAQSFVMVIAMALLLLLGVNTAGGFESVYTNIAAIEGFLDWYPDDLLFDNQLGLLLFVVSWVFAGLSVIGQPHIMVRFMSLNHTHDMWKAKLWYYTWFIVFYALATGVGLLTRLYFIDSTFDAELALPLLAQQVMPDVLVGVVIAGIFAATMSTADSLLLNCSSTLTNDIFPFKLEKSWMLKVVTVLISFIALIFALINNQTVFDMVVMAWAILASAFCPLLLALCFKKKPSEANAIFAMIIGISVAALWRYQELHMYVYEGLPGIIAGMLVLYSGSRLRRPSQGEGNI